MDLTYISQGEYNNIAKTSMTASEAFEYLSQNLLPRRFDETLREFACGIDPKTDLVTALSEYTPELSRESISKKVRGWISGKTEPKDRETLLQLCFALGLNEEDAQSFLCRTSDCGFHYRDPRELTYSFALRTGMSYHEALELYSSLPPLPDVDPTETVYTEALYNEFYNIRTRNEFLSFYRDNLSNFGKLHNTAYMYFRAFTDCLRDPDAGRAELLGTGTVRSRRLSLEEMTSEYLRMELPSEAPCSTYLRRMIKKYWPSSTSIKNMYSRREDITRKVLILLYVITEGIAPDVNYDFVFEDDLSPEESFEEHYDKLCIMLTDCGMALPDPRNIFDWAVLRSLRKDNHDDIGSELKDLLNRIFDDRNEADES